VDLTDNVPISGRVGKRRINVEMTAVHVDDGKSDTAASCPFHVRCELAVPCSHPDTTCHVLPAPCSLLTTETHAGSNLFSELRMFVGLHVGSMYVSPYRVISDLLSISRPSRLPFFLFLQYRNGCRLGCRWCRCPMFIGWRRVYYTVYTIGPWNDY
jgi:hypothetical protein